MPSDTRFIVLTLTHVIEATVKRADGTPIKDAALEIWQPFPEFKMVALAKTDEQGKAYLDWTYPGDYFLLATKAAEGTQSEFVQFKVSEMGVATPSKFDLRCHGAPWFYTMTLTYDRELKATDEQMLRLFEDIKKIEIANPDFRLEKVALKGPDVIIDFQLQAHSLVLSVGLLVALLIAALPKIIVAIGIAVALVLLVIKIMERFAPPTPKKEFVAPDGTTFPDQASLAEYLIGKADPHPWACPYEGCLMRFSTEAEKITHINQFHVKEFPLVQLAAIVSVIFAGAWALTKIVR